MELGALKGRDAYIGAAMQDEKWGGYFVRKNHRRESQHGARILLLQPSIVVGLPGITGGDETQPVRDARAFDRRLVAVRLRDGPRGHKAAGAPAEYGQPRGIRPSLCNGEVSGAVNVAVSPIAKMLINGRQVRRAETRRPAILRLQDHIVLAGDIF